jgi:hypothetical protein
MMLPRAALALFRRTGLPLDVTVVTVDFILRFDVDGILVKRFKAISHSRANPDMQTSSWSNVSLDRYRRRAVDGLPAGES